ncbi:MAG: GNAT family N-acetyltransferase [Candidatus Lokiarchaeota archaeon]|nr:GNAT family N-acetyltransferase [Candidatus Lokiarchaeota archaeon]
MAEITVRPPKNDEKVEFFEVYRTGIPDVTDMPFARFARWWDRSLVNGDLKNFWRIAEVDGKIVGVAINIIISSLGWGVIWELAIHPDWRKKGIGRAIVEDSEAAFLTHITNMTHYGIALKTHSLEAVKFVENLDYGIQSLILRLDGPALGDPGDSALQIQIATLDHIPILIHLEPDTYWGHRDPKEWEYVIRGGGCYVIFEPEANAIVGFIQLVQDSKEESCTTVSFAFKPGYGKAVVKRAHCEIQTDNVVFWIEDKHDSILDYLYAKGYKRTEAEFLAKKRIKR